MTVTTAVRNYLAAQGLLDEAALKLAPPVVTEVDGRPLTPAEFMFYRNSGTFDGVNLAQLEPCVIGNALCYRPRAGAAEIIRNGE